MNNAGVVHPFTKLVSIDGATMRRMLDINVMGVFYGLKHQIPVMERAFAETGASGPVQRRFRRRLIGAPLLSAYAAAKHAVVGLTRSATAETARRGVRINALCPAFTRTSMVTGPLAGMRGTQEEAIDRMVSTMPMRRLGEPAEIVDRCSGSAVRRTAS